MQLKFETKSSRVKGLSFHSKRPWLLASLHTGVIQLWDYAIKSLIAKFSDYTVPVRGIHFHPTQPLFVAGGDDTKIRVYNYKTKKCLFILEGHADYIRVTYFHNELPWIISSSDDQTIRLWNYQGRSLISIITGHTHYVMCAKFHPTQNLIVSASLDQSLRLWDFSELRKKQTTSSQQHLQGGTHIDTYSNEIELIQVMEGHDRGVNWCDFHPTEKLIVSASDDRKCKLWTYTSSKAYETDSFYGHSNNVSCVNFLPKFNYIISNAEDKTIKIWDKSSNNCLETIKKDNDRFWIIDIHPNQLLFAAGHDSGIEIYAIKKDKIPFVQFGDSIFYVNNNVLSLLNLKSKKNIILWSNKKETDKLYFLIIQILINNVFNRSLKVEPSFIMYNNFDNTKHSILLNYQYKEKTYNKTIIIQFEGDLNSMNLKQKGDDKLFYCQWAIFTGKGKILRLELQKETNSLIPTNIDYETYSYQKPIQNVEKITKVLNGYSGKVIFQTEEMLCLYDLIQRKIINSYTGTEHFHAQNAVWNSQRTYVAILCKKIILVMNKQFIKVCTLSDKFNIKSLIWTPENVIIYSTVSHIKFGILNGDIGILQCISQPLFLIGIDSQQLITFDHECNVQFTKLNRDEYLFKNALFNKNGKQIKSLINQNIFQLGNSMVAYLCQKNYQGIALKMVNDPHAKFSLAIDCGNLEIAYETSQILKDKDCYLKLAEEALRQGNQQLVALAYKLAKNIEKLQFLYQITGNLEKLQRMLEFAQNQDDFKSRFNNAVILSNIEEQLKVLTEIGQTPLAYIMALNYGQKEAAIYLKQQLTKEQLENISQDLDILAESEAIVAPKPIIKNIEHNEQMRQNWPHNEIEEEDLLATKEEDNDEEQQLLVNQIIEEKDAFKDALDFSEPIINTNEKIVAEQQEQNIEQDNWGDVNLEELDLQQEELQQQKTQNIGKNVQIADISDEFAFCAEDQITIRYKNSQLPGLQVALGNFQQAIDLLKKQIGAFNIEPYRNIFLDIYMSSHLLVSNIPYTLAGKNLIRNIPPLSDTEEIIQSDPKYINFPQIIINMNRLQNQLKQAYKFTSEYKLSDAIEKFQTILLSIPLIVTNEEKDIDNVQTLIKICVEYILALKCEIQSNDKSINDERRMELNAYMNICQVQPQHSILFLKKAMSISYKMKNFIYAAYFAKKLIILNAILNIVKLKSAVLIICRKQKESQLTIINVRKSRNQFLSNQF